MFEYNFKNVILAGLVVFAYLTVSDLVKSEEFLEYFQQKVQNIYSNAANTSIGRTLLNVSCYLLRKHLKLSILGILTCNILTSINCNDQFLSDPLNRITKKNKKLELEGLSKKYFFNSEKA